MSRKEKEFMGVIYLEKNPGICMASIWFLLPYVDAILDTVRGQLDPICSEKRIVEKVTNRIDRFFASYI